MKKLPQSQKFDPIKKSYDIKTCSERKDDDGKYLYWLTDFSGKNKLNNKCGGMDLNNDPTAWSPYIPYSYDAVLMVANALTSLIEKFKEHDLEWPDPALEPGYRTFKYILPSVKDENGNPTEKNHP